MEEINCNDLSYEEAKRRLIEIIKQMEGGQVSLEENLALWEQGEALAAHCQSFLNKAQARFQSLQVEGQNPA